MRITGLYVIAYCIAFTNLLNGQPKNGFPEYTPDNIREVRNAYVKDSRYEEGIAYLRSWQAAQDSPGTRQDSTAWYALHIALAYTFFDLRQLDSAEAILKPILDVSPERYPSECLQILNSWGIRLVYGGRYLEAKKHFEELTALIESNTLEASPIHYCNALHNLGVVSTQLGDTDAALEYYRRVEDVMREKNIIDQRLSSRLQFNLAAAYTTLGQYKQSVVHSRRAYALNVEQFGLYHSASAQSLNSLANHLNLSGDLQGALKTYMDALEIWERIGRRDHLMCSVVLINIGETLHKLDRSEEALPYINECIQLRKNTYGLRHAEIARSYKARGTILGKLNRYDEAFASMDTSLMALGYDATSENPYSGVDAMFHLFYALDQRADLFYDLAMNDLSEATLRAALQAYGQGITVLNDMRVHFKGKLAKGNLNQKSYGFYEPAIDLCLRLYSLTDDPGMLQQAFEWSVESKDNDFYDLIRGEEALLSAEVPDSVRERQHSFLEKLAELESDWYDATSEARENEITAVRQELDKEKKNYRDWLITVEKEFPEYYQLLYSVPTLDMARIGQLLNERKAQLVEYFIGDENAFAFVVNANGVHAIRLIVPDTLSTTVLQWRQELDHPFREESDILYTMLWAPLAPLLSPEVDHLVIIPDGVLHTVPFEILRKDGGRLIDNYSISYESSTRVMTRRNSKPVNDTWLGLAPEYHLDAAPFAMASRGLDSAAASLRDVAWIRLPGAKAEVSEIGSMLNGEIHTGKSATERLFRKLAGGYGLLHLSMHAWTDDDEPLLSGLIFSEDAGDTSFDGRLYAHEIFQLKLPASLVVLSACNTGIGAFRRGEGISSLANAFRYAGTDATVMSLWKVPDESTATIMKAFYRHLQNGMMKDEALRQAKLDYLANVSEPELKRPYYWAGFVLTGDTAAVFHPGFPRLVLLLMLLAGIGLIVLAVRRVRK